MVQMKPIFRVLKKGAVKLMVVEIEFWKLEFFKIQNTHFTNLALSLKALTTSTLL